MALNKSKLVDNLLQLNKELSKKTQTLSSPQDMETLYRIHAEKLADAIEQYVKSGEAIVKGVVTTGSATTQTQTSPVKAPIQ